jgi:hypothetical protein
MFGNASASGFRLSPERREGAVTLKSPCLYVMASRRNGTLYIGVTSNLVQRVWQHREGEIKGFTEKYG